MRSVRYLKVVLTVIAACLALICLRDVSLVAVASAKVYVMPGRYQITPGNGFVFRVDSLSGQVCTYMASKDVKGRFTGCTPAGE
jgi:hypothetical protein